ncbi:GNAT family N-acetyltransferase [Microbacterium esteraromaticum]|uniref:GNAT family N-acetyltransferase n=1 Tax=Microbacterium esteraromaticum TaxID=57043 RepID=UPI001CD47E0B|nr:GNAT family N-acetyltransferase [Microbacterium esteraromaticum]MCA1306154.1 GNAT family N-acetyltransferase [Microbacterium esteraromaticum]
MSTIASPGVTISPMHVPARLDADDAADFHAVVALSNAVYRAETGLDDYDTTAEELLPHWRESTDTVNRTLLARENAEIVGAVTIGHAVAEPTSAEIEVLVLPNLWGRGIEQMLVDAAEDAVRALGRHVMQTYSLHRPDPGASPLAPATGWGRISTSPLARLLGGNGYVLEQVERSSAFDLQADPAPLQRMLAEATAIAGQDYRVVAWSLPTPSHLQDGYAWVLSRMSTDVPSGGLAIDEEIWDAERVARRDQQLLDGGQTVSVVGVEHVPTGTLAAFNELVIGDDPAGVTHQYNTLVLKEHRGHRLGQIVKCANILRWRELAPHSPRIVTFNAEENRPMLGINEAMGFRPIAYAGAWQKKLS